jgi:mRNA-degrading endonuclease RelE of RelBE toxin-antitoxin system
MYNDEYHPRVKKDIKNLDPQVVKHIQNDLLDTILKTPHRADLLTGNLAGIYSYHFTLNRVEYRICYMVDETEKTV